MREENTFDCEAFEERLNHLHERIERACLKAGRDVGEVRLVAVTKGHGPDAVACAQRAGLDCFGESRVQEAAAKIPQCGAAEWHMIGHLQRNKVRAAMQLFSTIHSVDSLRLLEAIAAEADASGARPGLLLEVNVSGEAVKFGLTPQEVPEVLEKAAELNAPPIVGLMTMPPFSPEPEDARRHFRKLRELRDKWRDETGYGLEELSIGMTNDLDVAIEEGSTMIRVGTFLFGKRRSFR